MKVAGVVEEVNGKCDMIHQEAGIFKTRSLLLGTLTRVPIQAAELLYIWEKTWVVGRFVDVNVTM